MAAVLDAPIAAGEPAGPSRVGRAQQLRPPVVTAAVIGAATIALRFHDPHVRGSWGLCPFKALTGWDCPACGGLRAVNDLSRGHLDAAVHSNLAFVIAVPFLVGGWLWWVDRARRAQPVRRGGHRRTSVLVIASTLALVLFTVWRNTPWGSAFHVA